MLDFIQRIENLSLPEALGRLEGRPGLAPRLLLVQLERGVGNPRRCLHATPPS